ncbi:MAG: hypothetical protein EAY70_03685 [Sphingomonadales bacterium]|nr:MAG: hypothetical protein EAY70_03685 [Sphingomonadales bacterium]
MSADFTAYLPLILLGLVALVLAVWVLARRSRKARVVAGASDTPLARDVLEEGAAPAERNQALIDAPPAALAMPSPPPASASIIPAAAAPSETDAPIVTQVPPGVADPVPGSADDLTRIKGLGPKIAVLLGECGVTTFAQIAAWDEAEIERIDAQLGRFSGRITRDQWVEQAKLLAGGDEDGFIARFGKNG